MATKTELIEIAKSMGLDVDETMSKTELQTMIEENIDTSHATPEEVKDVPEFPKVKVVENIPQIPTKKVPLTESQERMMSHQNIKKYYEE
jgi:PP-loop superfamily ATP-utilizing enzyme